MLKNEIKWGVVLGYVSLFAQLIITLFYIPMVIDFVGQNDYGLYSLVASVMGYFSVLDMGFGNAMIRFLSKSKADNDGREKNINGLFLVLYSAVGLVALLLGGILIKNINFIFDTTLTVVELSKAKIMMCISVITIALHFPLSVFQSHMMACEKFIMLKFLNLLKIVLTPITTLLFLNYGYDVVAMVFIMNIYSIVIQLVNMFYCLKKLNMKINFKLKEIEKTLFKEILAYSFFIFLNIIVDNLYNNTDQVILGVMKGTAAVSIYAIAAKISSINMTFSTTISGVFLPRVTRISREENARQKMSDLFLKVSRVQLYIMLLILAGFIIFGETFINWWVGAGYEDAYWIVLLLIGPAIIPLTQNVGITVLQAENKHMFRSVVYIIIAILNVVLSIPLVKLCSGIGAAVGTALATFAGQILIMNWYYSKKIGLNIKKYWKHFISFAIPVLILAVGIKVICEYYLFDPTTILLITGGFVICYSLYCWKVMNEDEKEYIQAKIKMLLKH